MWQAHPLYSLNLIAAGLAALTATIAWRRRAAAGSPALTALMAGACIWSLASTIGHTRADLEWQIFWANVTYIGVGLVPLGWLLFALQYTGRPWARDLRVVAALLIEPAAVLILVWTNQRHLLFRSDVRLVERDGLALPNATLGPLFWAHAAYAYLLLALGSGLLLWHVTHTRGIYRLQVGTLLLAICAPWVGNVIYLSGQSPLPDFDLTPVGFAVAGLALAWDLRRLRLLDILPVARDTLIEQMSDGMLVLDLQGRVVDLNAAACATLNVRGGSVLGRHADQALASWPQLADHYRQGAAPGIMEIGMEREGGARIFEVRISFLGYGSAQAAAPCYSGVRLPRGRRPRSGYGRSTSASCSMCATPPSATSSGTTTSAFGCGTAPRSGSSATARRRCWAGASAT